MKRFLIIFLCLLGALPLGAWASTGARAWLDRDSMQLGETVTLNVETEDGLSSEPDFSVLLGDFTSLGTQSSRQISMSNGSTTAKTVWAIGLEPKRAGILVIPAFTIGATSTAPLTLTVLPASAGNPGKQGDNLFIEVSADPLSPYVQQQVRYTVKLYFALNLSEGALDEPAASGVVVQKLGRDKQYNVTLDERRYQVLERNYAVTPEASGTLTLPALGFRGSAIDNSDPSGFFRRGRAVNARSDAIELDVRAKPAAWGTAPWLPAASLSLTDESDLPAEIKVGEPLTRTIKLRAQGLGFEQLPELELVAPTGTEIYPDKADTQTRDDGTWLYGERTRKFALVPTRPGKLILPALEVQWWNTASERIEKAVLPEREINVLAASPTASTTTSPGQMAPTAANTTAEVIYPSAGNEANASLWRNLAFAASALWVLTLVLWWRSRRTPSAIGKAKLAPSQAPGRSIFLRACSMGDLIGAERALVTWARKERPSVRNLGELMAALDDSGQRAALDELQRMRYAGTASDGLSARLTTAFRGGFSWSDRATAVVESSALPPLYPPPR